jgi:hypothetical protein
MAKHYDDSFSSYKKRRLIDGSVYVLTSFCDHILPDGLASALHTAPYPIFQASTNIVDVHYNHPYWACAAVDNKADTLTQSQMLKDSDCALFIASQEPEIRGLQKMDVFEVQPISTKPITAKLLSAIWSYRRKRSPVGTILKHKSRLCVDGSQQLHGRDFWETYAPVVSWSTICLLLLLSTILNLKTRQVDYTQAFPQAPLADPVYMRIPQGWLADSDGVLRPHQDPTYQDRSHYICLKRNLYGCRQAARNWFQYPTKGLLHNGFQQSSHDSCLYLRSDCIMIVYTDDCLIFARDDHIIDALIKTLASTYALEDQGTVNDYLGIRITKNEVTKEITMTQPGLIESILKDLNLLNPGAHTKDTPAMGILHPDRQGHPREDTWNYRSLIGKLNYLAQNTRPDISFAVHQCTRFSNTPTALHELAVKWIERYLLLTKDKGIIMSPRRDFRLDMYVDADFAGLWHRDHAELCDCALSRTGYIITYCDCPIHWASKLQNEIALSTTESEYIALSMATRELLPLRRLVHELHQHSFIATPLDPAFSHTKTTHLQTSQIFEDNASCIILAYSDGTKPRTKHLSLKWHHFKDQIRNGAITVTKVASNLNWADIFTKPLCSLKHNSLRRLIMGW